jgi:hypothetical protein
VFAGRTGGASEDAWIDDLTFAGFVPEACGDESAQTVHFIVSNDNPGLFGAQPAIDAQGTLTYTPAANQSGLAHVTVVAMDTGGTAFGGQDTSAPQTFDIQVNAVGDCPTNAPLGVTVAPGGQVSFQLVAGDPDGGPLTYAITQPPAHGIVVLQVQTGAVSYSPNSGYCGPDSFAFTVNDGQCTSSAATVSITVSCATNRCPTANALSVSVAQGGQVNFQLPASDSDGDPLQYNITQPPAHGIVVLQVQTGATSYSPTAGYCGPDSFKYSVTDRQCAAIEATVSVTVNCTNNSPPNCMARISPAACGVAFPGSPTVSVVSLNGTDGCVILDGSGTTDAENDPLHFTWKEGTNTLGTAAVVTNCFSLGCHVLTLTVTDGQSTCTATLIVCVISPCEAVEKCIALVDNSPVVRKNKRPILASLKAACASFDQGDLVPGINQLQACQNKIHAQISRDNPTEAQAFIKCIQQILDAIDCMTQLGRN